MKRIIACLLTGLLAVGMMAGCSKKLTPEEQAASEAAVLAQQLQEEETQTGLKRLISNNLTEYEQPFYDFVDSLQKGDAAAAAKALGVPNTFGDKLQSWVIVNNYETFQKAEMKSICLNSAKDGASAVLNIYMKSPKDVTTDTQPDYTMNVDYVNGAWALTPPTGVIKDYAFSAPTNKVTFEGTDLSSYAAKSAATGEWMVTLPRALDLESNSTYVITNDMGDYNGHVYDVTSDGTVNHMRCNTDKLAEEFAALYDESKKDAEKRLEAVQKMIHASYERMKNTTLASNEDESMVVVCKSFDDAGDDVACVKAQEIRDWKEKHEKDYEPISDEALTFMSTDEIYNAIIADRLPERYAFEFSPWEEILSWNLAEPSVARYGLEHCLAGILWEMTFFGVDPEGVEKEREKLDAAIEEAKQASAEGRVSGKAFSFEDFAKEVLGDEYTEDWYPEEERERDSRNMAIASYKYGVEFRLLLENIL